MMNEHVNPAQYHLGIDLGTTNCVVAAKATAEASSAVDVFSLPQLVAPGQIEERSQLPSFLYIPHEAEINASDKALPWTSEAPALVGAVARQMGSKTPLRLVSSAKSWLCQSNASCMDDFLPLNSPDDVEKTSPFEAIVHYLEHVKSAWNHAHPDALMEHQDITVTIPASFDPGAREATADAADAAGLERITLLEEPQAALYSWVHQTGDSWRDQLNVGDIVLVVDVGGGTTDLSLVKVTEDEGNLALERVAVGDHILLGGDNMDLALAYRLNAKLAQEGTQLQPWQIQALTHSCRDAKEQLLSDADVAAVPIVVPTRGSKLLGATLRTELSRQDVEATLIDGFLPQVSVDEKPLVQARGALTQIGLSYAQDAAITKHLAAFLSRQSQAMGDQQVARFIKPTAVLLNGGVLKADPLAQRLMAVLNSWLTAEGSEPARLLVGADYDLAVARGASYFGEVRSGSGVRIRGGLANAYYVGIESAMPAVPGMPPQMQALCVAPFGMEEGQTVDVAAQTFGLIVGEPVCFKFYGSAVRRQDQDGTLLDFWDPDELYELPDIEVTLTPQGQAAGDVVPVYIAATVTTVGTLKLEAVSTQDGQRWQVEFDVRSQ